MLFTLCEWIVTDGEPFLVRADNADKPEKTGEQVVTSSAVQRSLAASEEQKVQEEEAKRVKASRMEFLKALQEEQEQASQPASKVKDKIALEIRTDPGSAEQHDLAGYDDTRIRE